MTSARFILGSRSPRRCALLAQVGLSPRIAAADVDEAILAGETPMTYALRVATAKAVAIDPQPEGIVLAADTVVALDGMILRKPSSHEEAKQTLRALSGRTHVVHTAVALRVVQLSGERLSSQLVSTAVRFRALSDREIDIYVATGEPMDKAGGYGIQGAGGSLVDAVDGSYTNVVGLPVQETLRLLALAGIR